MPLFHLVILALVQGITEFLPVSSSGHLVIVHMLTGATAHDILLDLAVHVGTLFAALLYFRRDIAAMLSGLGGGDRRMLMAVIAGSLPVIAAGFILHVTGPEWTRSLHLLAWCTLVFGILLGLTDRFCPDRRTLENLGLKDAFLIGAAQVIALIPGVSRSGITMTAGRALGFSRAESARFSLLLAVVAISGAGTLGGIDLIRTGDFQLGINALIAAILAFLSALAAIALMMRWLARASFMPFVIYRIVLGIGLLVLLYSGALSSLPAP